jgi:hypothetical protein
LRTVGSVRYLQVFGWKRLAFGKVPFCNTPRRTLSQLTVVFSLELLHLNMALPTV